MGSFRIRNRRSLVVLGALAAVATALVWTQVGGAVLAAGDPTVPGAAVGPQAAPGNQVQGGSSHWFGIDQTNTICTTSDSPVDMPGMSVTFNTTTANQRVLIMFQAEWMLPTDGDRALINATVDGVTVSGPGDSSAPMAAADTAAFTTNGYNFLSDPIHHPGLHTARIQWERTGGTSICADERTLVVLR